MTYAQGTMTSANASSAIRTILDGLLIAAGWSLVETLSPSGVFRNSVYKSSGSDNLCGYDWYIVLAWETAGTESISTILQGSSYDTGTHILSNIALSATGNDGSGSDLSASGSYQVAATSSYVFNAATNTPTTQPVKLTYYSTGAGSPTTSVAQGLQWLFPSSAFAYWVSITLDHIAVFTTISAGYHLDGVISSCAIDPDWSTNENAFQPILATWQLGASETFFANGCVAGSDSHTTTNYISAAIKHSDIYGPLLPQIDGPYSEAVAWAPYLWAADLKAGSSTPNWYGADARGPFAIIGQVPDFYLVHGGSIGDTVTIAGATYVLGPLGTTSGLTAAVLVE